MATATSLRGFVPPYFFEQCSRADPKNANEWLICKAQAVQALITKVQALAPAPIGTPHQSGLANGPNPKVIVHLPDQSDAPNQNHDSEKTVLEANAKKILDFLRGNLGMNSFDNQGSDIKIYLGCKTTPDNAVWRGNNTIHIGNPVDPKYTSLTRDIDILAHEIAHGIIKYTVRFQYQGQSGALNESWADVFGSMVKQFVLGQNAGQADWLMGDEFVKDLPGKVQALRSLKDPGNAYMFDTGDKDPQVDRMSKYGSVDLSKFDDRDDEGVHIYSGIPNHAFYLYSMEFPNKPSWEIAGKVWLKALSYSKPNSTFKEFAVATIKAADELSKKDVSLGQLEISEKLKRVWKQVEVLKKPDEKDSNAHHGYRGNEKSPANVMRTHRTADVPENQGCLSFPKDTYDHYSYTAKKTPPTRVMRTHKTADVPENQGCFSSPKDKYDHYSYIAKKTPPTQAVRTHRTADVPENQGCFSFLW